MDEYRRVMGEKGDNRGVEHWVFGVELCEGDFEGICGRYHFGGAGLGLLRNVYGECFEGRGVSVYFKRDYNAAGDVAVVMTVGQEVDDRQSLYMEMGKMSEAYAVECLAMEVLNRAYGKMDELLYRETGLWCGEYRFPGSNCPLEEAAAVIKGMSQSEVGCNGAFVLTPKQSVVYITNLQREKPVRPRESSLCAGCNRRDCPNRKNKDSGEKEQRRAELNYGYRRIFGERIRK